MRGELIMEITTTKRYSDEVIRLAETFIKNGDLTLLNEETVRVAEVLGISPTILSVDVDWHIEDLIGL
ncbi:hypothetical protein BEYONPHE_23 [Bacillus phage Beyonphe]|nr:hypothetical protein BEYONPHE_23 [Bacillus phage Beyonphe]